MLNKKIYEAKKIYLKDKLGNPHKGWKLSNEFKGNSKAHTQGVTFKGIGKRA